GSSTPFRIAENCIEIMNFFDPTCQFLLSYIPHINHLALASGPLLLASTINGTNAGAVKSRSLLRPGPARDKSPFASSGPTSAEAVPVVVGGNGSTKASELWSPAFDESLKNAIGHSLEKQNGVIQEILELEPRLSRAAVITLFVRKLLNYASNSNLERRESAIRQILDLQPGLDREVLVGRLNQM